MKLFACDHCGNTVYFENAHCERCGHQLGYLPGRNALVSLVENAGLWSTPVFPAESYVFCANARFGACNWLLPADPGADVYCAACCHNETIPAFDAPANLGRWQIIERAKKRLFYSLLRLALPLQTRNEDPVHGLSFRFLADLPIETQKVLTGHEDGIITIALAEADDAEREARRTAMGEPYRTLLGHFRHEIGHHYWDLLVANGPALERFRTLFGDETRDYGAALQTYYANGAPNDWQQSHISAYATAHPWEDFAEIWAHYLHITDTAEMAADFGLRARPRVDDNGSHTVRLDFDPYGQGTIENLADHWVPLASLLNNLNRTMGLPDAYPFILNPMVIEKLGFVHDLVHSKA
ncbi:putative zinc-binding metallopeptidase [uncultured Devosia sp.]|uniref:zinc-binding metallopeptidase family protein n=1 Tax=uncultured Devosia sp. TaxID=211434 RepID=UPI0035CB9414